MKEEDRRPRKELTEKKECEEGPAERRFLGTAMCLRKGLAHGSSLKIFWRETSREGVKLRGRDPSKEKHLPGRSIQRCDRKAPSQQGASLPRSSAREEGLAARGAASLERKPLKGESSTPWAIWGEGGRRARVFTPRFEAGKEECSRSKGRRIRSQEEKPK